MALFLFTKNILAGQPIKLFNNGEHIRDFTFVDDIVEGVIRVSDDIARPNPDWDSDNPDPATSNAPFRILNIGNNARSTSPSTLRRSRRHSAKKRSGNSCLCSPATSRIHPRM